MPRFAALALVVFPAVGFAGEMPTPLDPQALGGRLTNASADLAHAVGGGSLRVLRGGAGFFRAIVSPRHDRTTYRLQQTVEIPNLQVAGIHLRAVKARLVYRDGSLLLEELTARLPGAGKLATLSGKGSLRVVPLGSLLLDLRVDGFDLASLDRLPQGWPPLRLGGKARADVTLESRRHLRAIEFRGTVRVSDPAVGKLRLGVTEFRFALRSGALTLDAVRARVSGGEVTGSASLPLREADAGWLDLTLDGVEVARTVKALTNTTLPLRGSVSGTVKATITASKADQRRRVRANVDLTGRDLRVRKIPTRSLRGTVLYQDGPTVYELEVEAFGEKIRLDGQLPPDRPK